MLCHLFWIINTFFQTNISRDRLLKEPISTKKLGQGDAAWLTKKTVMGWEINTKEHHLRLTLKRKLKVRAVVANHFSPSPWIGLWNQLLT